MTKPDSECRIGILIFGASGTGTTTLAAVVGRQLGWRHVDLDHCLWEETNPPHQVLRSPQDRLATLRLGTDGGRGWVISGSPGAWIQPIHIGLALAVFLEAPTPVRLVRLSEREARRFGPQIQRGGSMYEQHIKFMDWSAQYEEGRLPGRSRASHEAWIGTAPCSVLRLASTRAVEELGAEVLRALEGGFES